MFKGKFLVLSLIVAALLCWQIMPVSVDTANSGIVDPCSSSATSLGGCWVVCPAGDGPPLNSLSPVFGNTDATISITVKDATGAAVPGIPAADFWLVGCTDGLVLCGGSGSINATAATDANGQTTIVGSLAAGGQDASVSVVVQGVILTDANNACAPLCLAIETRSPDIDKSLLVQLIDFTLFGAAWEPGGGVFDDRADYKCDGSIDLIDFTVFGVHWLHECN